MFAKKMVGAGRRELPRGLGALGVPGPDLQGSLGAGSARADLLGGAGACEVGS